MARRKKDSLNILSVNASFVVGESDIILLPFLYLWVEASSGG